MARRALRLAVLRGLVLIAMLLPLENALHLERLDERLSAVAEARRRRRTPRARRRLAARYYRQGQQLMAKKRYRRAIRTFNRSFGLSPTPRTLLALARCYELSGRLNRARRMYQRILAKAKGLSRTFIRKRLAMVKQRIDAARPKPTPPTSQPASQPASQPSDGSDGSDDGTDVAEIIEDTGGDMVSDIGGGADDDDDDVTDTSPLEVSGMLSGWLRSALDVDLGHDRSDGPTDVMEDILELRHRMLLRLKVNYGAKYQAFVSTIVDHVIRERPPEGDDTFLLFNGRGVRSEFDASVIEAYVAASLWRFDVRAGMLRVPWGKSDYASPNDIINPRDGRNPLREELEVLRLPVLALETTINLAPATLELIWQPLFRGDRISIYGSDFGLAGPRAPAPMRGLINFVQGSFDEALTASVEQILVQTEAPPTDPRASSLGLRVKLQLGGVDFSLYYHYGYDSSPYLEMNPQVFGELNQIDWANVQLQDFSPLLQIVDNGAALYRSTYIRRHHVGGDVVATLGSLSLRAEVAVDNRRVFYDPQLSAHIQPALAFNAGVEYAKSLYQTVVVEAAYLYIGGGPDEFMFYNHHYAAISGMARWGILRGDLVGELRFMFGISPWTYVLRPQVAYKLTQSWWISAGVVVFGGNERSFGGLFDRNDLIFFEGTFNL